jgi:hypothetical protein
MNIIVNNIYYQQLMSLKNRNITVGLEYKDKWYYAGSNQEISKEYSVIANLENIKTLDDAILGPYKYNEENEEIKLYHNNHIIDLSDHGGTPYYVTPDGEYIFTSWGGYSSLSGEKYHAIYDKMMNDILSMGHEGIHYNDELNEIYDLENSLMEIFSSAGYILKNKFNHDIINTINKFIPETEIGFGFYNATKVHLTPQNAVEVHGSINCYYIDVWIPFVIIFGNNKNNKI